jgi:hypothetical protein
MFQKTVNLKEKMEQSVKKSQTVSVMRQENKKSLVQPQPKSKAADIDEIYRDDPQLDDKIPQKSENFQKIDQPQMRKRLPDNINYFVYLFLAVLLGLIFYQIWFKLKDDQPAVNIEKKWYMVKLANGESFYGKIGDLASDPVTIENVYYNYNQAKDSKEDALDPVQNLRLVKRGKETYGPSGTLEIVRSQLVYMEALSADSKVLKAIYDYEKQ